MDKSLEQLIMAIQANNTRPRGSYTMAEILEGMGLPTETTGPHYQRIYVILANMREQGLIETEKIGHNVYYRLVPQTTPADDIDVNLSPAIRRMLTLSERKEEL